NIQERADNATINPDNGEAFEDALTAYRSTRRAIIHTLDVVPKNSRHAQKVVRGFRKGLYYPHVDFHSGDVSQFVLDQLAARTSDGSGPEPYLSRAILDLPSAHNHLATVSRALRVDGLLAVFNPSVTQIAECVDIVRKLKLPLMLEQVVELGHNMSSGRAWDVRTVRPRHLDRKNVATQSKAIEKTGEVMNSDEESDVPEGFLDSSESETPPVDELRVEKEKEWQMVCRPKVFERVVGGGFLGLWRKMRDTKSAPEV
ncbi:hypothetical protein LTS18_014746, partial [Coniosporium uncinatum]